MKLHSERKRLESTFHAPIFCWMLLKSSWKKLNLTDWIDLCRYFITFRTIRSAPTDVWMRYSIWILILNPTRRYSRPKVPKEYSIKRQAQFTKRSTFGRRRLSIELAWRSKNAATRKPSEVSHQWNIQHHGPHHFAEYTCDVIYVVDVTCGLIFSRFGGSFLPCRISHVSTTIIT